MKQFSWRTDQWFEIILASLLYFSPMKESSNPDIPR